MNIKTFFRTNVFVVCCCVGLNPWQGFAQAGTGLRFGRFGGWAEVLAEAQKEHKEVFIDCYATWCEPCKLMDGQVYPDSAVGAFYNTHFVSVRVQCDTGKTDDSNVQGWYRDAAQLVHDHHVTGYPCLLYFSPEGRLLHEAYGYHEAGVFIGLGREALNPEKQFFTQAERFRNGVRDTAVLMWLAQAAHSLGEKDLARAVSRYEVDSVLLAFPEKELVTRANMFFVAFTLNKKYEGSKDRVFTFLLSHQKEVNGMLHDSTFCQRFIEYVVSVEYIDAATGQLQPGKEPNWAAIEAGISERFGAAMADKVVTFGKDRWYASHKLWLPYCRNKRRLLMGYRSGEDNFYLNNDAMTVGTQSADKYALRSALGWEGMVLADSAKVHDGSLANYIDTYAFLLFRLGRSKEALHWEEYAVRLDPGSAEFAGRLKEMRLGKLDTGAAISSER